MSGDEACARVNALPDGKILCYTKEGTPTGYRNPMSVADMQMYSLQRAQQQAEIQDFNNSMNAMANDANRNAQAMLDSTRSFSTPTPGAWSHYGSRQVRCIGIETYNYVNCRY